MKRVEFRGNLIYIGGKPIFIYSGEIHYFRIPFDEWEDRILKAKEAGLNCISSYIPWIWHEPEEGRFDFTGDTLRERDVVKFIEIVKEHGLFFIARIGPYFNAELIFDGLPVWLVDKENIRHLSQRVPHLIDYNDGLFLEYVRRWYQRLIDSIKDLQVTRGGNIILFQLCNEIGVLNWLEKIPLDFSQVDLNNVDEVNQSFEEFISIERRHSKFFADYFKTLKRFAVESGVEVPFIANVAQFEDYHDRGRAFDAILTGIKFEHFGDCDTVLAGDFYPKRIDYDNFHDVIIAIEVLKTFSYGGNPVISMELQSGFIYDRPRIYPSDVELLTTTCYGHGLGGVNFYMFSGGVNYQGVGVYGKWHDWQSPVSWDGNLRQSYQTVKEISRDIVFNFNSKVAEAGRGEFRKIYDVCVGIYKPYFSTMFLRGKFVDEIEEERNHYFHDGILRLLTVANVSFKFIDIERDDLNGVKNLILFAFDWMDEDTQGKLLNFIKNSELGEKSFILFYDIPTKNLRGEKTDIFYEMIGIKGVERFYRRRKPSLRDWKDDYYKFIDIGKIVDDPLFRNIPIFSKVTTVEFGEFGMEGIEVIAEFGGKVAGFVKKIRKTNFVFLGFGIQQRYDYQIKIIRKILEVAGVEPRVSCFPEDVHVSLFQLNGDYYIYVANYHETEREVEISVRIDESKVVRINVFIEPRKSKMVKL